MSSSDGYPDMRIGTATSQGLSLRGALFAGFGLIFLLWIVSAYDLVRRLVSIEVLTTDVSSEYLQADRQLSTIRSRVLLSAVYIRDAVTDESPNAGTFYRDQLRSAQADVERAMDAYQPVGYSANEREDFRMLRAEVQAFWETVLPIVASEGARQSPEARTLLRDRLIPKRETIIAISERIKDLNRLAVTQQQEEVGRIYRALRWRIWGSSGLAVLAGVSVAWFVTRYAARLESRIREQSARETLNTRDLQRLSARLVHAQEEERRSIARELHDEVGQALTAIKVELAVLGRHSTLEGKAAVALREARTLAERTLSGVRDLSQVLHPAMLDDLGLSATIAWYLDGFSARSGIRTDLAQDVMDARLAAEIETCVYRIVQEALTNVARHSGATWCRVTVRRDGGTVRLMIEDNGHGFVFEQAGDRRPRAGLGLLGIEERVLGFRGTFDVDTAPGRGTRLTVALPWWPRVEDESHTTIDTTDVVPEERT